MTRFDISFEYRVLSRLLGLPPSRAYVAIEKDRAGVRMGWPFRAALGSRAAE